MSTNLILHERIHTTVAKAKELRPWIERLVHKAKQNDYQGSKYLQQTLFTQDAVRKLEQEIAPRFKDLPAGFTRVKRVANRKGDAAPMAMIEILGNPMIEFEKNEIAIEIEQKEM
jgi:large subunit ribosomal protein L17